MAEKHSERLKLNKTTVRLLSSAEKANVAGGAYTDFSWCICYTARDYYTCQFFSCQDGNSQHVPHSCFGPCW